MKIKTRLIVFFACAALYGAITGCGEAGSFRRQDGNKKAAYQCIPCGYSCDKKTYSIPGTCPDCMMDLVPSASVTFGHIQPSEICGYIGTHPNIVLLDVRTPEEFEGKADPDFGTLKNAINLPIQQFDAKIASIKNLKDREIIVYCSHSHRSPQAAYLLTRAGFTHIINLDGGMSVLKDAGCKK